MTSNYLIIPKEDFDRNAKVDVSQWVKTKQGLSYIPWNISVSLLRSYNNNLYYEFERDEDGRPYFRTEQGVYLMAYLFDMGTSSRTPTLFYPVRGFGNKGEPNPGVDLVGNAMQRAVSKVIAQFTGLGWSLYSKFDESIDFDVEPTPKAASLLPRTQTKLSREVKGIDF
jgi:hypothetical protein